MPPLQPQDAHHGCEDEDDDDGRKKRENGAGCEDEDDDTGKNNGEEYGAVDAAGDLLVRYGGNPIAARHQHTWHEVTLHTMMIL